jgi:hypothetical protein
MNVISKYVAKHILNIKFCIMKVLSNLLCTFMMQIVDARFAHHIMTMQWRSLLDFMPAAVIKTQKNQPSHLHDVYY